MRADIRALTILLFVSVAFGQTTQVFHFKAADSAEDLPEIATVIRNIGGLHELTADSENKTLTIRGTAKEIAFTDWLFNELDAAPHSSKNEFRMSMAGDDVVHIYHVNNADTVQQLQEIATSTRSTIGIRRLFTYNASRTMVARGTPGEIALMVWLLAKVDKPAVGEGAVPNESSTNEYKYPAEGDEVVKVFYLTKTPTVQEFQEIAVDIRTLTEARRLFTYNAARVLMVRGTSAQIGLATWLAKELDNSGPPNPNGTAHEYKVSPSVDDVVRVFYLSETPTVSAFQAIVTAIRKDTHIRNAVTYNSQRAFAVRGTTNEIAWADQLIKAQNK
jgi:hypothetical protein